MYKKFTKDQFPLEAEHMAVDTGTDQTTGWDYKPRTDPEEESYMQWRFFSLNMNISKVWQYFLLKLCKLCKQEVHF